MKTNMKDRLPPIQMLLIYFLPIAAISGYMIWKDVSLSKAVLILSVSTVVSSAIMFTVYYSLINPVEETKATIAQVTKTKRENL
jgi:hypothetical protein